ncbi:DUF6894 family protein [Methylobacterium pseudosasicola]|uniref:DUF6894 family protein n=1 Tax=Methylobacterium pseudosasicola TaxID=582667 RepID=UPI003CC7A787
MDALSDMARDKIPDGDRRTFWVKVRDQSGAVMYSATLDLIGSWHPPRAGSRPGRG